MIGMQGCIQVFPCSAVASLRARLVRRPKAFEVFGHLRSSRARASRRSPPRSRSPSRKGDSAPFPLGDADRRKPCLSAGAARCRPREGEGGIECRPGWDVYDRFQEQRHCVSVCISVSCVSDLAVRHEERRLRLSGAGPCPGPVDCSTVKVVAKAARSPIWGVVNAALSSV